VPETSHGTRATECGFVLPAGQAVMPGECTSEAVRQKCQRLVLVFEYET
jgi:hypothetical protein